MVETDHKRSLYRVIIGHDGLHLAEEEARLAGESRTLTGQISAATKALAHHVPKGMSLDQFIKLAAEPEIDAKIKAGGEQSVKLPAGHMVLYPASSLHRVTPVTRGARIASFFWIQSMVRDEGARRILFELDQSVQAIGQDRGQDDAEVIRLTGVYHNLLRRWADV